MPKKKRSSSSSSSAYYSSLPYDKKPGKFPCSQGDELVTRNGKMFVLAKTHEGIKVPVPCSLKGVSNEGNILVKAGKNVNIEVNPHTKLVSKVLVAGDLISSSLNLAIPKMPDLKAGSLLPTQYACQVAEEKAFQSRQEHAVAIEKMVKRYRIIQSDLGNLLTYADECFARIAELKGEPDANKHFFGQGKKYRKYIAYDVGSNPIVPSAS
jgi:hypothetical protein